MNKFSYLEYRDLLQDLINEKSRQVRGVNRKLAEFLGVHTTFLTHVTKKQSHFSQDQALKVAEYFSFTNLETDFFITLISLNRAGNQTTKKYFQEKLDQIVRQGLKLKERLNKNTEMSLQEQSIFYSEWVYSAVRLATALPEGKTVDAVAKILSLPVEKVDRVMAFLLKVGLCKIKDNQLTYNVFSTYVDSNSPFVKRLHDNWRLRSVAMGSQHFEDLQFTSAATLTQEDFLKLRDEIVVLIQKFEKVTDDSNPQIMAHLNIDWLKLVR